MGNYLSSIPTVFGAICVGFLAVLGIRITYPIVDAIMSIFPAGVMRIAAVIVIWLIYVFVLWFLVWVPIFTPKDKQQTIGGNI